MSEDGLLHVKGELSRKSLRYAEAWARAAGRVARTGELNDAWDDLTKAALDYAEAARK